jgi:hypothetical protein
MRQGALDRLVDLVRRELGADDVRVVENETDEETIEPGKAAISCALDGAARRIVVVFREAPADVDARERRLEMLVQSFRETLANAPSHQKLGAAARLHAELEGLVERALASDALVIDADSPVVWGASEAELVGEPPPPNNVIHLSDVRRAEAERAAKVVRLPAPKPPANETLSQRAIHAARALPALATLNRGGHLHHVVREPDFGYVARSFASIYVLLLVYGEPFDELRAEREINASLPAIERLILALPPLDPGPRAGAAAGRRSRRR